MSDVKNTALGETFDSRNVAPHLGFEPIPKGDYPVHLIGGEVALTAAGTGTKINLEAEVLDGPFKGRKVYENINYRNPNPQCEQIGQGQFSALCHATSVVAVSDISQLLRIPFTISVGIDPARVGADGKSYDARNKITGFKPLSAGAVAPAQAAPPAPTPAAAPPAPAPAPTAVVAAAGTVTPVPIAPAPVAPLPTAPAMPAVAAAPAPVPAAPGAPPWQQPTS